MVNVGPTPVKCHEAAVMAFASCERKAKKKKVGHGAWHRGHHEAGAHGSRITRDYAASGPMKGWNENRRKKRSAPWHGPAGSSRGFQVADQEICGPREEKLNKNRGKNCGKSQQKIQAHARRARSLGKVEKRVKTRAGLHGQRQAKNPRQLKRRQRKKDIQQAKPRSKVRHEERGARYVKSWGETTREGLYRREH
ncbi:hypothetical protein B0H16DRAFT_1465037 [Mycena metata]|uniref:Uncharacterized protein n=1 Tax=Mycena metata TaxID=1033252 RepID=A0AAD7N091_9AGAR|nr:hypothetical protein B0H16DRAFT_1465037 [Mycena metata]